MANFDQAELGTLLRLVYFPLNLFEYVVTTLREHFEIKLVEKEKIKDEF